MELLLIVLLVQISGLVTGLLPELGCYIAAAIIWSVLAIAQVVAFTTDAFKDLIDGVGDLFGGGGDGSAAGLDEFVMPNYDAAVRGCIATFWVSFVAIIVFFVAAGLAAVMGLVNLVVDTLIKFRELKIAAYRVKLVDREEQKEEEALYTKTLTQMRAVPTAGGKSGSKIGIDALRAASGTKTWSWI